MSLKVENLRIAYRTLAGDVVPVDNVSFSLADGEIMGLAGESGSGKSTLGNALVYLDPRMKATGGKVTVDGKEVPSKSSFELSGGMRQRVTIIMSSLLNPSLLVADEVTSALDVSTQRAVGEMLIEFRDRGYIKSAIAITHDLAILAQVADSIAIMYAGRLSVRGPTSGIVDKPLHPYPL